MTALSVPDTETGGLHWIWCGRGVFIAPRTWAMGPTESGRRPWPFQGAVTVARSHRMWPALGAIGEYLLDRRTFFVLSYLTCSAVGPNGP